MRSFAGRFGLLAAVAMLVSATGQAHAGLVLTSSVNESGFNGSLGATTALTAAASPFDFTSQNYGALTSIDSLSITLTINDGDTGVGNFDRNNLSLALDGINTGLLLNGFSNNQTLTLTLTTLSPSNQAQILAALHADGKLAASIVKSTSANNTVLLPSTSVTTLKLEGVSAVPEPSTLAMASFASLGGLVALARRRKAIAA